MKTSAEARGGRAGETPGRPENPAWTASATPHLPKKAPLMPRLRAASRRRQEAIGGRRPNFGAWSRGA